MFQEVLLYTQDVQAATQEIVSLGGRVTQQFTDVVLTAQLPDSVNLQALQHSTTTPPSSLDPISQLAVDAWQGLQARSRAVATPSPTQGLSWDTPGYTPPQYIHTEPDAILPVMLIDEQPEESTGTATSRYMVGSIAVGVMIVSGTQADLVFSSDEQRQIIQEVQEGLNFLANAEPRANITFVYDIQLVTVSAAPGSTADYESAEAPWRNAALAQLGFPASRAGSVHYVQNLRSSRRTDWAYVGYFTKYPLHHFAYAVAEKVTMHYGNDGWGSDQINRVFAHETCHIFGAADEYGNCACGGSHGELGFPNNNCVKCTGTHVPCLMEANVLDLCQWSRGQIGWDERLFPSSIRLAQAMWLHGHSMEIEVPDALVRVWRAGFYIEVEGKPNTDNWFHFAIPTKVIVNDRRLRIGSVMLLFETLSNDAIVRDVHIFDGDTRIVAHNGVNHTGNAGFVRFDALGHPPVRWGVGISIGVHFGNGPGARMMRFKAAGCDLIP